jgi:hypothetical protein
VYCTRCGTKNDDDAAFCKKCGADLQGGTTGPVATKAPQSKEQDDCERDCQGSKTEQRWFWGIVVIIIGVWIVIQFGLPNIVDLPPEIEDFEFCWVIWIIIGIAVLLAGVRMVTRSGRGR